jgi:hypothetical protein
MVRSLLLPYHHLQTRHHLQLLLLLLLRIVSKLMLRVVVEENAVVEESAMQEVAVEETSKANEMQEVVMAVVVENEMQEVAVEPETLLLLLPIQRIMWVLPSNTLTSPLSRTRITWLPSPSSLSQPLDLIWWYVSNIFLWITYIASILIVLLWHSLTHSLSLTRTHSLMKARCVYHPPLFHFLMPHSQTI